MKYHEKPIAIDAAFELSEITPNNKGINLIHNKNNVIEKNRKLYRCICADSEFAIFAPIKKIESTKEEPSHWRTGLSKPFVVSNSPNMRFEFKFVHDDFFEWISIGSAGMAM